MKIHVISTKDSLKEELVTSNRTPSLTYGVVKETYYLNGKRNRSAYGIVGYSNAETDGTSTIVFSYNDITDDYAALSKLVKELNQHKPSEIHIPDIIENFLS